MAKPEEIQKQRTYIEKIRAVVSEMTSPKACVVTYGCQQNEADSERIMGTLCEMGYTQRCGYHHRQYLRGPRPRREKSPFHHGRI